VLQVGVGIGDVFPDVLPEVLPDTEVSGESWMTGPTEIELSPPLPVAGVAPGAEVLPGTRVAPGLSVDVDPLVAAVPPDPLGVWVPAEAVTPEGAAVEVTPEVAVWSAAGCSEGLGPVTEVDGELQAASNPASPTIAASAFRLMEKTFLERPYKQTSQPRVAPKSPGLGCRRTCCYRTTFSRRRATG
jgi:hypothetical protein